ncbi:NADH pyrophosphatase [Vibrio nigripulchritudo ATCC 27043]|uniref:NAD(+) diphosphatase n=1 Tax=Vibrio nigripulchritudo TaxID=28173 RepID=UPI00021C37F3|nr:NAD(+) diphosphatase [Vibrio nigripulchritudo]EGU59654.1 NADH pyrophosphatase [Vibrio nigripulchritudo ATCC 27043]
MFKNEEPVYWCVVEGSEVWIENGSLPLGSASSLNLNAENAQVIGNYQSKKVVWLNHVEVEQVLPMTPLRSLLHYPEELFWMISRAIQFGHMSQTLRFCPQCGGRNHLNFNQLAMQCGDCRTLHYPRIFPCIIVAIRKENQILLAQHNRHRGGMYTVIAGFVEVGETLEQCVAREVKEETGIEVSNITYFGSQPWAFPSSLMMGFIADYRSGDIKLDKTELVDAQWFGFDELPEVAPEGTIARALIREVTEKSIPN